MAFDYKKEYKELYMPKNKPEIVTVPKMNYIAVRGKGNPNEEGGAYQNAISVLYAVAYTLKMSYKTDYKIEDFDWAVETASKKKRLDCSSAEFLSIDEGLCVQMMHLGAFDDEPATVAIMDEYIKQNGYTNDMNKDRLHHEIYLSDARKVAPEKWKTVIRHPIKKV